MTINSEIKSDTNSEINPHHTLDTTGLICPEPVMMLHKTIRKAAAGDIIEIIATDPATTRDIPNFCRHLGHQLLSTETAPKTDNTVDVDVNINIESYRYVVQKKST